jgi:Ca-activated chloride channel homolog
MMRFIEWPWALAIAGVIPVVVIWLTVLALRRRAVRLARLGSSGVTRRLGTVAFRSPVFRPVRLGLAALLMGLAFAGPRWGLDRALMNQSGVDVVLALDASTSMLAEDDRPSRLERMKQEVRRLRAMSQGDRFGLLAFAGRSYVLTPLTVDDGALLLFLDNLDPSVVGMAGSSLAATIRQGVSLLSLNRGGGDRAVVLMSDGEAFEDSSEIMDAAKRAREQGVFLITVGFGSTQGSLKYRSATTGRFRPSVMRMGTLSSLDTGQT